MKNNEAILQLAKELNYCPMFIAMFHKDNTHEERKRAVVSYRSVKGESVYKSMRNRLKTLITMDLWKATNSSDNEVFEFVAKSGEDARHWVINHLDTSKQWCTYNISEE